MVSGTSRSSLYNELLDAQAEKIGRNYIIYKKDLSGMFDNALTEENKNDIKSGVQKVLKDYGETIKIEILEKISDEIKFTTVEDLIEKINNDVKLWRKRIDEKYGNTN